MNGFIYAVEAKLNTSYRLYPNKSRSRHIVAKCVGFEGNHPVFSYTNQDTNAEKIITDVEPFENIQVVKKPNVFKRFFNFGSN